MVSDSKLSTRCIFCTSDFPPHLVRFRRDRGLLTSKSNQCFYAPKVVNLVKFQQAVSKICLPKCFYLTIFGVTVTLTYDLLTCKSNRFISVPKFQIWCNCTSSLLSRTNRRTNRRKTKWLQLLTASKKSI